MKIMGTGSCIPETVVSNKDLENIVDTSNEWIYQRTGIVNRHLVNKESTLYMAATASKQALYDAGCNPMDIQLIIVATISADSIMPAMACQVQAELGADNAVAFDLNAACTGFIFALIQAHAFFEAGIYRNALIIGVETLSRLMNWKDRETCILFGDGAGAVFIKKDNKPFFHTQYSNGKKGSVLTCKNKEVKNPIIRQEKNDAYVHMDGREVFKFAVRSVPECILEVLNKSNLEKEKIKYFILHQANIRIIQNIAKRLGLSEEVFPHNLEEHGNTSSASIPILMNDLNRQKKITGGDKLVLAGFGGGLTWASVLLEW